MIFYFSGTGNSLAAAKHLLAEGEELINMTDCVRSGKCSFTVTPEDKVGFVFPVYFAGLPSVVQSFLNHVKFSTDPGYTYAVLTCGGMAANAGGMLEQRLAETGIILDATFPVEMPDNYVLMYSLDDEAEQDRILAAASAELDEIRLAVEEMVPSFIKVTAKDKLMTKALYPLYVKGRKTDKFFTTDDCVGCGICTTRCPYKAIVMENGRPKWVKERCAQCLACMRCGAIQYGKQTIGRARYTHPDLRKKKHTQHHQE